MDACALIQEIRRIAAIGMHHFDKGLPDVPFSVGRHLQTKILQRERFIFIIIVIGVSRSKLPFFHQRVCPDPVRKAQVPSIIQMLQMSGLHDTKAIGGMFGFQNK